MQECSFNYVDIFFPHLLSFKLNFTGAVVFLFFFSTYGDDVVDSFLLSIGWKLSGTMCFI